ncbi:MAG: symmetrical bis(5'-nucleosyl)-tetraphosphatase [Xylophilus ampelinus]
MAFYCIGDIQGCDSALGRLLDHLAFSPSRDRLVLLGDLVNRGPESLQVLRRLQGLGDAVQCILGNHDLHLLAVARGHRPAHRSDTLDAVLQAPDRDRLQDWLRHRSLALETTVGDERILMVHAGVLPAWTAAQTLALAGEVEAVLRDDRAVDDFLRGMYGNRPAAWCHGLEGMARLRVIVNALTRLRFCSAKGVMDFDAKEGAASAPQGLLPWFEVPGRRTADVTVAFGHWSTLGWIDRPDVLSLDTGCVWGGCLSAVRLDAAPAARRPLQVRCAQSQVPGATG